VAGKLWRERTRALAEFEKFLRISVNFWSVWSGIGPNHK
jgi:hypothetical protein